MDGKPLNISDKLSKVLRIERNLNDNRPVEKRRSLTMEELQRIADKQGVERRVSYYRRGTK